MNPIFRKFDCSRELSEQRKLFKECFPENKGTVIVSDYYYNWKFQGYPDDIHSYEYCCLINNEIIGYYAAIPYRYTYFGEHVKVAMVCDVMTGVKARGQGIFTKLGQYSTLQLKNEGLAFSTGYPIRPEVIPGHRKAGWNIPFNIPMYGKFVSLKSFLNNKNLCFLNLFLCPLVSLINSFTEKLTYIPKNFRIEHFTEENLHLIEGLDIFFDEWQQKIPIVLNKNIKFLKWRLGAPEKNYHILILKENSKIIGYLISRRVIKENVPCFGILDLCMLKGYEKFASVLLFRNESICKNENCELILFMLSEPWGKKYRLKQNLYFKTPFKFSFIIKKYGAILSDEKLYNQNNWHLTWIDSDDL